MTERDFAFWLQGYFELISTDGGDIRSGRGVNWSECVRKHADLALQTSKGSGFLLSCKAVADQPQALRAIVAAQFEHVIDKDGSWPEVDMAHIGQGMRC